jgi:hypothetical protein
MKWYEIHGNLLTLTRYLVYELEYDQYDLIGVLAKPWNWEREFNEARRVAEQRVAT